MSIHLDDQLNTRLRSTLLQLKMMNQQKIKSTFHNAAPIGITFMGCGNYKSKRLLKKKSGKQKENTETIQCNLRTELIKRMRMTKQSKTHFNGLDVNRAIIHINSNIKIPKYSAQSQQLSSKGNDSKPSKLKKILSFRKDNPQFAELDNKYNGQRVKIQSCHQVTERPISAFTQNYKINNSRNRFKLNSMQMRFKTQRSNYFNSNELQKDLEGWHVPYEEDDF